MSGLVQKRRPNTKEAWRAFVDREPPAKPEAKTWSEYRSMSDKERRAYDSARKRYHAALGPYSLGSAQKVLDGLSEMIEDNDFIPQETLCPGGAIDGEPTLGKTTLLHAVGKRYERRMRDEHGDLTPERHEYVPVCSVALPRESTPKGLATALSDFFYVPYKERDSERTITSRLINAMNGCYTSLVLIDDIHFAAGRRGSQSRELNDYIKQLMNDTTATYVVAGVGLEEIGFFSEGKSAQTKRNAQIGGRFRRYPVRRMSLDDEKHQWEALLKQIANDLVLCGGAEELKRTRLARYLHSRAQGSIGVLMAMVRSAAMRIVKEERGAESEPPKLSIDLFEEIKTVHAAEGKAVPAPASKSSRSGRTR